MKRSRQIFFGLAAAFVVVGIYQLATGETREGWEGLFLGAGIVFFWTWLEWRDRTGDR